jgi:isopenicillin-N N-acyltransferase like protein
VTTQARTLPLIEIRGGARERGRQHGEAAREQIRRSIAFHEQLYARSAKLSWAMVGEQSPRWVPIIEDYAGPEILEEVHGVAEGAGVEFADILALNGRGELSYGNPFLDESRDGCSSFALTGEATGDGHVYCGQNWDWRAGASDTVIMLRIVQPPKPTIIMQTEAGQIGRQGANSVGLALNANGLGGRFPGTRLGVPSPYVRRRVLDSIDMHDALHAIFTSTQTYCGNVLLTHREGVVIDLETTPGRHGWMYPTDGMLVHANHFQAFVPEQIADTYRPFSPDSLYRTVRIEQVLRSARNAKDSAAVRDVIATAMRDHFGVPNSVCNHADSRRHPLDQMQTVASSTVDLTTGEYRVVAGLPCESKYTKLPWNLYDDAAEVPKSNGRLVEVP